MNAFVVMMLLIIAIVVSYAVGVTRGRKAAARVSRAVGPEAGGYREGYLAGHVAGWRDAEAKHFRAGPQTAPATSAPPASTLSRPAYIQSPMRLPAPHSTPPPAVAPLPVFAPPLAVAPPAAGPVRQPPLRVQQPPVQRENPAEAAARKAKRDQQNINITLYVASLLLVAAGALFVGTSLPELFRFAGIWFITALFYTSGLIIHAKVPRLRPAAIAFVGTGLALVPVTGLAMYNFVLHNGPAAWLVTSLLGTIAYAYTAVRLDNKVLAFLSLSFVVSTAWSGVSILGGALVWYFTSLIGVAILMTVASLLRPRWLPPLYVRPLMLLHPFVVPFVALAVSLTPHLLSKGEYALVMLMCGTYFAVMVLVPRSRYRLRHYYSARAALTLALLGLIWDISADVSTVMLAAIICLGVQSLGVAFAAEKLAPRTWWNDAVSCLGLQLVIAAILTVLLGVGRFDIQDYLPLSVAMLTAMVLGWKLGHGTEFAPGAVAVVGIPFIGFLGAWPVSLLLASAGLYWFLRAAVRPADYRLQLIFAGRLAVTLAVPAMVAGALEGHPDRAALTLAAFVAAAGAQQAVNAILVRGGVLLLAPQASLAGFGGAALAGLMVLPALDDAAGRPVVAASLLLVLSAGVASGLLIFPATLLRAPVADVWRPTMSEVLAPVTMLITGLVAAASVSRALGNVVLLVAVAYCAASALRLAAPLHRQGYWWLSRAAGTLLAGSAYADAMTSGWTFRVAGEMPSIPLLVITVAAAQLCIPLLAVSRRRFPRASTVDAGTVLAVMLVGAVVLTFGAYLGEGMERVGWQPGASAVAAAIAAVLCGVIMRAQRGAWLFAPAALVLLLPLRLAHVTDIEILLGVFAAYCAFMMGAARTRLVRGGYLMGLRVLAAGFIVVTVADLTDSPAAVHIALAVVLMGQHAITLFLRKRAVDVAFQRPTAWAALGAQLLLPLVYLLEGNYDGGGRWLVILQLALVPAAAALTWRFMSARGSQYLGVAAAAAIAFACGPAFAFPAETWLHQPLLAKAQVPVVLLALGAAMVAFRIVFRKTARAGLAGVVHSTDRWFWLVSALFFVFAGGLLAVGVSVSLAGLSLLVLAVVLFVASHLEQMPALYAAAAPSVLLGAIPVGDGLLEGMAPSVWGNYAPWLVGGVGTFVFLYSAKLLGREAIAGEVWRRNALLAASAAGLAVSAAAGVLRDETSMLGFVLVVATGVLVVVEAPHSKWLAAELAGLVAVAALQRALLFVDGARPDWFWAAQWYVVTGVVLAGLRYIRKQRTDGLLRLCIAAGALSLSSLGIIVGGTSPQHLYVLVAHVVLLILGVLVAERVIVWWGAAGVALSVMWALRSYAFAMLALVAVALIVLAVWRLNRRPATSGHAPAPGGDPDDMQAERTQDRIR
ncbi:hypothetical protein SAMN04487917_101466 [Arthrobacter sp. yr096]|uniref:hypothetical protein n=1 Tax=Arthrobacter sp. yr096 TaxID=1761750 RepID=UPI0008D1D5F9|nr:hypothetical protein [Arthrobacter sp. yr096]SEI46978.1 hypothetical protein SAMN04487917_101466 [Arthrobacter sp. yr096]